MSVVTVIEVTDFESHGHLSRLSSTVCLCLPQGPNILLRGHRISPPFLGKVSVKTTMMAWVPFFRPAVAAVCLRYQETVETCAFENTRFLAGTSMKVHV